jgi:hypothetical protein
MQKEELAIKAAEQRRKETKDQADAAIKAEALRLQDKKIDIDVEALRLQGKKIDIDAEAKSTELGAKIAREKEDTEFKQELEGTKLGVKIARDREEFNYKQEYEGTKLGVEIAKSLAQQGKPTKGK